MPKYGFKYDVYDTNADAVQAVLSGRADANMAGNTVGAMGGQAESAASRPLTLSRPGLVWAIPFRIRTTLKPPRKDFYGFSNA